MTKKEISRILREARDLMNDGGKHWIKGKLSRTSKGEKSYCAIGAVCTVVGVRRSQTRISKEARPALLALAEEIWDDRAARGHSVWRYTDDYNILSTIYGSTTWKDIKRVFTKAAKSPKVEPAKANFARKEESK